MSDDLRVAVRAERMLASCKVGANLAIVVDLSVENDGDRLVLVGDGRVAGYQVDDGKAILRDSARRAPELAPRIRTAMVKARELLTHHRVIVSGPGPDDSTDATHQSAAVSARS
jgi:hypothetical protein